MSDVQRLERTNQPTNHEGTSMLDVDWLIESFFIINFTLYVMLPFKTATKGVGGEAVWA